MTEIIPKLLNASQIWISFTQGDKQAFSNLFKTYYGDLKAYGMKISNDESLAQEAIQILFTKLWERKAKLNEVSKVKSYLIRAYRRTLIDLLQAEHNIKKNPLPIHTFNISPEEWMIFQQEKKERAIQLSQLMSKLPKNQKEVIYLRFYNQLSYLEISEILDLNYQTVRNYGVKAIRFLEKGFKK
jgi:RNA polymerase sigma factor (sigma-70 family)